MAPEVDEPRARIGELLIAADLITELQLRKALEIQKDSGSRIINILMTIGALNTNEFLEFLSGPSAFPAIELAQYDISPDITNLITPEFALKNEVMPVELHGNTLTLAMMCPLDVGTIDLLELETGLVIRPFIASSEDIQACLNRFYSPEQKSPSRKQLEGSLNLTTAVTMLRHLDSLPALPGTVQKVREMLFDDTGSATEVAEVISRDPAIAAKVLKVANSAAYGFSQQVDSVQLAVSLLGLTETYSVVVTSAVLDVFTSSSVINYKEFWRESSVCAAIARALAKALRITNTGIFSAALLHDLGRLALAHIVPEYYSKVDPELKGTALVTTEEAVMGLSHSEAGHQLAEHWDFPDTLQECIRFHHTPSFAHESYRSVVAIIHIADVLSRITQENRDDGLFDLSACAQGMAILKISEEQVLDIYGTVSIADAELPLF